MKNPIIEKMFVEWANANSEAIKALTALSKMSEEEKTQMIEQFLNAKN